MTALVTGSAGLVKGDHRCYYTDLRKVQAQWPAWRVRRNLDSILEELIA